MIPISDSVAIRRTPWVTWTLVAACVLAFLYELTLSPRALDLFLFRWGAHPQTILAALANDPRVPKEVLITLFTSQFLHGGWLHLLGNMLFLWVFGRAIEDKLGHLVYLLVYLLGGAGAGIFQSWIGGSESEQVLIGASGAIATVLGAYLVSFPTAWVSVLVPILFFWWVFDIPAVIMLFLWFVGQFFTGIASLSSAAAAGNVAVWAHVAGFALGVAAGLLIPSKPAYGVPRGASYRRNGGPGPAGLISSIANLAALLLAARAIFILLGIRAGPAGLEQAASLVYGVTDLVVWPFEEVIPRILFMGLLIDLPSLAAMLFIYIVAGFLAHTPAGTPRRR